MRSGASERKPVPQVLPLQLTDRCSSTGCPKELLSLNPQGFLGFGVVSFLNLNPRVKSYWNGHLTATYLAYLGRLYHEMVTGLWVTIHLFSLPSLSSHTWHLNGDQKWARRQLYSKITSINNTCTWSGRTWKWHPWNTDKPVHEILLCRLLAPKDKCCFKTSSFGEESPQQRMCPLLHSFLKTAGT